MPKWNQDEYIDESGFYPAPPTPAAAPAAPVPSPIVAPTMMPQKKRAIAQYGADPDFPAGNIANVPGTFPGGMPKGGAAGAGACPPGQVPKGNGKGCKPAGQWWDDSPDELAKQGVETCDEANHPEPKDCYWCDFDTRQWKLGWCPGGAGGGAGGKGGSAKKGGAKAAGPGTAFGSSPQAMNFNNLLEQMIRDALNSPSRYTPQALQALYGQITSQSSGQIQRGEAAVRANAARAGMSRAGNTLAQLRDVRNVAEQQRGAANVGVMQAKINADFQDKMGALDRAQRYLDSLRDNEYRYTLMGEQRRQFDANLALGYANLANQKSMLSMQLNSQMSMLQAQQGFQLLLGGI